MSTVRMRLIAFCLLCALLASAITTVVPGKTSATPIYSVAIEGDEIIYVDVGPGTPASTQFNITFTNDGHNIKETVDVRCSGDSGANITVSENLSFVLFHEQSKTITFYININRGTEAPNTISIILQARVLEDPSDIVSAFGCIIIVKQFSYIVMNPIQETDYSVYPGSSKTIDINVANRGNGQDIIVVGIANRDELIKRGWEIPKDEKLSLNMSEAKSLSFTIKAPFGITLLDEDTKITVRAVSELPIQRPEFSATIYTKDLNLAVKTNSNAPLFIGAPCTILIITFVVLKRTGWLRKMRKNSSEPTSADAQDVQYVETAVDTPPQP